MTFAELFRSYVIDRDINLDTQMKRTISIVALAGFALVLRLFRLTYESIWIDEMYSIIDSRQGLAYILGLTPDGGLYERPLYYILLHYWTDAFGLSLFTARLPAVIFGVLAVVMLFKLGEELFDFRVGAIAALLLTVSSFNIRHSQQVRMYSLMTFLALVSFYFLIRFVKTRSKVQASGYLISSFLLLVTHPFSVFVIIAQNSYIFARILFSERNKLSLTIEWSVQQIILVAAFTPWIFSILNEATAYQARRALSPGPTLVTSVIKVAGTFWKFAGSIPLTIAFAGLVALSIARFEPNKLDIKLQHLFSSIENAQWRVRLDDVDQSVLLFTWMLVPIMCLFLVSHFMTPFYAFRYVLPSSAALYLLVARGITRIDSTQIMSVITVLLVVLIGSSLVTFYTVDEGEQWEEAADYVEGEANQGDLVILNRGDDGTRGSFNFYYDRTDTELRSFPSRTTRHVTSENIGSLDRVIKGHDSVFLVLSHSQDCQGLLIDGLEAEYDVVDYRQYNGVWVYEYEDNPPENQVVGSPPTPTEEVLAGCP